MTRRTFVLFFSFDVRASWVSRLVKSAPFSCREVREIAARHLEDIRAKLSDLKKLERVLSKTVARCSGGTAPDCAVLDILDIQRAS